MPNVTSRRCSLPGISFQMFLLSCLWISGCLRPYPVIREHLDSAGRVDAIQFIGPNVLDKDLIQIAEHPDVKAIEIEECSQVTDQGLLYLESAPEVERLSLVGVPITDDGLAPVAKLSKLAELNLKHTKIKGSGLSRLASMSISKLAIFSRTANADALHTLASFSQLKELELNCQDISLAEMPYLAELSELESLNATGTPVGEGGLASIRSLARLRKLILSSPDISDASIAKINALESLEEIELSRSVITNEGLASLVLPRLKWLSISGCQEIDDAGLANLAGLPELEVLMATESAITGEDFSGLKVVPKLRKIYILDSQFKGSDETIQKLKEVLPSCEVVIQSG